MRKRAIGLELTEEAVYLAEVVRDREEISVQRGEVLRISPDLIVAGILKDLPGVIDLISSLVKDSVRHREVPVVLGISGIQAFIRKFTVPKVPVKEFDQIVRWEGESILPYRITEVVYNYQVLNELADGYEVLFVALLQERINPYLQLVEQMKIPVEFLTLQPFGLVNYAELVGQTTNYTGVLARLRRTEVDLVVYLQGKVELIRTAVSGSTGLSERGLVEFFQSELQSTLKHLQATSDVWLTNGLFFGEDTLLSQIRAKMPLFYWRHISPEVKFRDFSIGSAVRPEIINELPCACGLGLLGVRR